MFSKFLFKNLWCSLSACLRFFASTVEKFASTFNGYELKDDSKRSFKWLRVFLIPFRVKIIYLFPLTTDDLFKDLSLPSPSTVKNVLFTCNVSPGVVTCVRTRDLKTGRKLESTLVSNLLTVGFVLSRGSLNPDGDYLP